MGQSLHLYDCKLLGSDKNHQESFQKLRGGCVSCVADMFSDPFGFFPLVLTLRLTTLKFLHALYH